MATENKGVTVYLPQDIEECLTQYCTEYGITRKAKDGNVTPSLGTGVVAYLREKMMGDDPSVRSNGLASTRSNGLTSDDVRSLIDQAINGLTANTTTNDVQTTIDEAIEKAIASIQIDMVELMGQVSELRASVAGKKTRATKPTGEPVSETIKIANRLTADDGLASAVRKVLSEGLAGQVFCERLFTLGYGANDNTKPFHISVAGRFKQAIAYLDEQEDLALADRIACAKADRSSVGELPI